jgi:nickel superoxide dismutase
MKQELSRITRWLDAYLPFGVADAHCDIPCGIYDPRDALQAADTVIKMTSLILDLEQKGGLDLHAHNSLIRYVMIKEEHARKAKDDLLVIWSDYFKPEHLQKYPELHDLVWQACKLGSAVKQTVDLEKAKELKATIERVARIFQETKKAA